MIHHDRVNVRFGDCDPAGIVFFPQYLVMLNSLVEKWFDKGLGVAYSQVVSERRLGLPTVRLEVDFTAVSRHGEELEQRLQVRHLGRSSLDLLAEFSHAGELRLRARQVLVCTSLETHRPLRWPQDLRDVIDPYVTPLPAPV